LNNKILGVFFVLLSILIVSVTAIVYETAQQTVTQTIKNIATLVLNSPALGNIEEGETKSYNKTDVAALGDAISIATYKADVYLHLDSDVDSLSTYYTTYDITIKYATVPGGSSHSVGETAATITLVSPDPAGIGLDVAGSWTFDFEITTTAKSVSSDQATTVTIVATAENS
jgi:hypothetical protein